MSALEVENLLLKLEALKNPTGDLPVGARFKFHKLYTVLGKVHAKVLHAEPLVDSRSSAAYILFTAHLREIVVSVDDALDKYLHNTSFFSTASRVLERIFPKLLLTKIGSVHSSSSQQARWRISREEASLSRPGGPSQILQNVNVRRERRGPNIAKQFEKAHTDLQMLLRLFSTYVADLLPKHQKQQLVVQSNNSRENKSPSSSREPDQLIGREKDMKDVLKILGSHETELVVAVVGMAGVGKTALIRKVFNNAGDQGFHYPLWVQVSQNFDPEKIFRDVIRSLHDHLQPSDDPESYWWSMKEGSVKTKYLVVLDDVWNEDQSKWNQLLHLLCGKREFGSKVVVSTRILKAAPKTARVHKLQPLSIEDSLNLLSTITTDSFVRETANDFGFEGSTIRNVAEICSGLPNLIHLLSSFLNERILKEGALQAVSAFYAHCMNDKSLFEIAEDSYKHLAPNLQLCFLYYSLFPPDHIFDSEEITSLWVAEGFTSRWIAEGLNPRKEAAKLNANILKLLEECGIFCKSESEGKTWYTMQLILHNFTRNKGNTQYTATDIQKYTSLMGQSIRYLSLTVDHTTTELPVLHKEQIGLRTLILARKQEMVLCHQKSEIREIPSDYCRYLTALRVLDLHATKIDKLPDTFGMLSNLRYLNLSQTDIAKLPESFGRLQYLIYLNIAQTRIAVIPDSIGQIKSLTYLNLSQTSIRKMPVTIGNLQSLQILRLSYCQKLEKVPHSISSLTNLQKLDLEGCHYLSDMPQDLSNMKNLKELNILECSSLVQMPIGLSTLSKIEALPRYMITSGNNNCILELQSLANLKRLGLENIGKISTVEAKSILLQDKHELQHLSLHFDMDVVNSNPRAVENLIDLLEPNHRLETLEIISYAGERFPCWMSNIDKKLENLTHVKLINLKCTSLQALEQLPKLNTLEICGMDAISKEHNREILTFPSLKKLTFSQMLKLESWPEDGTTCPCLEELSIIQCPKFQKLSVDLPIKKLTVWMGPHELFAGGGLAGVVRSLKSLSISLCEELSPSSNIEGLRALSRLEYLKISGCDKLESLPPGLENLTSLKSFSVIGCSKLHDLSRLVECTSLRSLVISGCPMVSSVPQGLKEIITTGE